MFPETDAFPCPLATASYEPPMSNSPESGRDRNSDNAAASVTGGSPLRSVSLVRVVDRQVQVGVGPRPKERHAARRDRRVPVARSSSRRCVASRASRRRPSARRRRDEPSARRSSPLPLDPVVLTIAPLAQLPAGCGTGSTRPGARARARAPPRSTSAMYVVWTSPLRIVIEAGGSPPRPTEIRAERSTRRPKRELVCRPVLEIHGPSQPLAEPLARVRPKRRHRSPRSTPRRWWIPGGRKTGRLVATTR